MNYPICEVCGTQLEQYRPVVATPGGNYAVGSPCTYCPICNVKREASATSSVEPATHNAEGDTVGTGNLLNPPLADSVAAPSTEAGAPAAPPVLQAPPDKRAYYHEAIEKVLEMRKYDLAQAKRVPAQQEYYFGRAHRCDDILFWLGHIEANIPAGALADSPVSGNVRDVGKERS